MTDDIKKIIEKCLLDAIHQLDAVICVLPDDDDESEYFYAAEQLMEAKSKIKAVLNASFDECARRKRSQP